MNLHDIPVYAPRAGQHELPSPGYWITAQGEMLLISTMSDRHITNILNRFYGYSLHATRRGFMLAQIVNEAHRRGLDPAWHWRDYVSNFRARRGIDVP